VIIAIDGPSGTGKSTVAQEVARALGFFYFDTGAMYRAFAYFLHKNKISFEELEGVREALKKFDFDIQKQEGEYIYLVSEEDVSSAIRQNIISQLASTIAKNPLVRLELLPVQRAFAKKGSFVMEGRDIGTVVFPDAEVKIFLTAEEKIRAKRRLDQLKQKFPGVTHHYEQVLAELRARDIADQTRDVCPLRQAEDAILIDTSYMSVEEVIEAIVKVIKEQRK